MMSSRVPTVGTRQDRFSELFHLHSHLSMRWTAILYRRDTDWWGWTDTPTDILPEGSARCVQSFDDSLILQFAWRIAFHCVLHRCGSQDIHCWKCFTFCITPDRIRSNLALHFHGSVVLEVLDALTKGKKGWPEGRVRLVPWDVKVRSGFNWSSFRFAIRRRR